MTMFSFYNRCQPRRHYQEVKTSFTIRLQDDQPTATPADQPEPDAAVTVQLRTMQRQLQQLVQLPAAIQATLQAVSSRIDTLVSAPGPQPTTATTAAEVESDDSGEFLDADFTESLEDLTEEEDGWSDMEMDMRPASQSDSERSAPPATPPLGEQEKLAKMQKMETLNKCWPWADAAKPVYKIAEHYEPVYARCIDNKVKWLEQKISDEQILTRGLKGI